MSKDKPLSGCKTKRTVIERIEVVGPMEKSKSVMDHLHSEGWQVTRSGAYTSRKMFPKCDVTRFLFVAEREAVE